MRFGYARVSTSDAKGRKPQHTDGQEARLRTEGQCEEIYSEKVTGTKASRPEWDKLLARLRPGDELVVVKLDRIGRSLINLVDVLNELSGRGVRVRSLDQGLMDTGSANGKLLSGLFALLAEWERNIISERTVEGLEAARARHGGKLPTRGSSYTPDQIALARRLMAEREQTGMSVQRIADMIGCHRATVYELAKMEP